MKLKYERLSLPLKITMEKFSTYFGDAHESTEVKIILQFCEFVNDGNALGKSLLAETYDQANYKTAKQ